MKKNENDEGKKEELIKIGLKLFSYNGMNNFSIRKLVEEANISIGLFYYYFKSKEDFILECVEIYNTEYIKELERILLNKNYTLIDKINLALNQYLEQFSELFRIDEESDVTKTSHLMIEDLLIKKSQPILENLIIEGINTGEVHVYNIKIASYFLACGLVGVLIKMNLTEEVNISEEIYRLVYSVLNIENN